MKKLFIVCLSVLLVCNFAYQARAEFSATTVTGTNYKDTQVFLTLYNNMPYACTANYAVVIDLWGTDGAAATTVRGVTAVATNSTMGAYFIATNTTCSYAVIGVADETIASGTVGRVCIRGPHLVAMESDLSITTEGMLVGTADSIPGQCQNYDTGRDSVGGVVGVTQGYLGWVMDATQHHPNHYWVWINPGIETSNRQP